MSQTSLLALTLLCFITCGCADHTIVSEGDRVGTVTKLSHKRMDCISNPSWNWEGELSIQGGTLAAHQGESSDGNYGTNHTAVSAWAFSLDPSIKPDEMIDSLRSAMNTGKTVRISYRQEANRDSCKTGTDYIVTAVIGLN